MKEKLESLPNVGKITADKLRSIGIQTRSEFLSRDPYEVFEELRVKVDPTLCRCALAAIIGAHVGIPWHKIMHQSSENYFKKYPGVKLGGQRIPKEALSHRRKILGKMGGRD